MTILFNFEEKNTTLESGSSTINSEAIDETEKCYQNTTHEMVSESGDTTATNKSESVETMDDTETINQNTSYQMFSESDDNTSKKESERKETMVGVYCHLCKLNFAQPSNLQ